MLDLVDERPQPPRPGSEEPIGVVRCVLCGKPLKDDVTKLPARETRLCFWCAYVEPQG